MFRHELLITYPCSLIDVMCRKPLDHENYQLSAPSILSTQQLLPGLFPY